MIKEIKRGLKKVDDNEVYEPKQIVELGLLPDVYKIYRLIKAEKMKAIDISSGGKPQYRVKGSELRRFVSHLYDL